jgi:hypothetical protein
MVAQNGHHIHRQFANAGAIEQVAQAMVELADHQDRLALHHSVAQVPFHRILLRHWRKCCAEIFDRTGTRIEHHAHEKVAAQRIVELLCLADIAACFKQVAGHPGNDSRLVLARQCQNQRCTHQNLSRRYFALGLRS